MGSKIIVTLLVVVGTSISIVFVVVAPPFRVCDIIVVAVIVWILLA